MNTRTFIAKVEVPFLYNDNKQAHFFNRDKSWSEYVPITAKIKLLMGNDHEAYFQLTMNDHSIVGMKRLPDQKWGTLDEKKGYEALEEKKTGETSSEHGSKQSESELH